MPPKLPPFRLAREHDVIMDGRDIGTVVLPQADLKVFLTAAAEARARRRYRELLERGQKARLDQVLSEVIERDRQDTEREIAPLRTLWLRTPPRWIWRGASSCCWG